MHLSGPQLIKSDGTTHEVQHSVASDVKEMALDSGKVVVATPICNGMIRGKCANLVNQDTAALSAVRENTTKTAHGHGSLHYKSHSIGTGSGRRRSIFDGFWGKEKQRRDSFSSTNSSSFSSTLSSSSSPMEKTSSSTGDRSSIQSLRLFAPPREFRSLMVEQHQHFENIDEVPVDWLSYVSQSLSLPPLPFPLRRYQKCKDMGGSLGGVYPIISKPTRPILRKSSYNNDKNDNADYQARHKIFQQNTSMPVSVLFHDYAEETESEGSHHDLRISVPLTLTTSMCLQSNDKDNNHVYDTPSLAASSDSSFSSCNSPISSIGRDGGEYQNSNCILYTKKVKFDPRITISEFDDGITRVWYNEKELSKFKTDTLRLAQQFLSMNPLIAEQYSRIKTNPVTGGQQRKALFSLPVLNSLDDEINTKSNSTEFKEILHHEIQNILIIDSNETVLDLFCKALEPMFPHAKIHGATSVENSLQEIALNLGLVNNEEDKTTPSIQTFSYKRGFDLIIVDDQLPHYANYSHDNCYYSQNVHLAHPHSFEQLGIPQNSQDARENYYAAGKPPSRRRSSRRGRSSQHCSSRNSDYSMSGSEVIRNICEMEACAFGDKKKDVNCHAGEFNLNTLMPAEDYGKRFRPLLIGVSIDLQHDAETLWECGADMVWGKPPPHMGDLLRNQILTILVGKRQNLVMHVK